jgi:putative transposase
LAIERFRAIEPYLRDGVTLTALAQTAVASERTLQRWVSCYRAEGLTGLERKQRSDRGRRNLPDFVMGIVQEFAVKRPRPPVSSIHRKVAALAIAEGHCAPSYSSVARVVRKVPESRIAATIDPAAYRDHHELVYHREAAVSNDMFLPDLPGHLIRGKPLSAPTLSLNDLCAHFEAFVCRVYHTRVPTVARANRPCPLAKGRLLAGDA